MKELTLPAVTENIRTVTDFVDDVLVAVDCPFRAKLQLNVAIDELFGNIARYAYPDGAGQATVRLELEGEPPTAILTFIDNGKPFNPLERPDPDITLSAEERQIGGLGIYVVKKTMDAIEYEYRDGQNILTLRKKLVKV